jgi:predicted DsbA family dithiol-disulfide isomerase
MADALFRAEDLSPVGCEQIASRLGLDMAVYRDCVSSARTSASLERDRSDANASGVQGLPTMYVGSERFEGAITAPTLRASIDRALRSRAD